MISSTLSIITGENKLEMYKSKFGEARVQQMLPQMTKTFAELGIQYSIGGLTGNTLDSHRLIHWAGEVMRGADFTMNPVSYLMYVSA